MCDFAVQRCHQAQVIRRFASADSSTADSRRDCHMTAVLTVLTKAHSRAGYSQWRRKHETSGGADRFRLRSSLAQRAQREFFFSIGVLKWSRIALMGSLQISTGSALGKSSMQE